MIAVENVIFPLFTTLAAALLLISFLAYRRSGSKKMLILSGVFLIFLTKGVIISISLWIDLMSIYWMFMIGIGIDSLALILLYISTLRV
jgi:hypothetical protein